ncbi:MAG: ATP-binding protein [Cellulophaga sp.]|nr:ATP-binding protein [Cellulophaga sp.]
MLKKYQQEYAVKNVQFILINTNGELLESDQAIFKISLKSSIFDIHPFFDCLHAIKDALDKEICFNCVHFKVNGKEYITDITFVKKPEGILVTVADYTAHYNSYQKIAQARNESIIHGELIAIKNAELEIRENFKNTFIRNFSHELRNPLTSIISITKILGDTELTAQQRTMIDFLNQSNSNLKLLLEDILSISLISSGSLKLRESKFSLYQLFELVTFTYQAKAQEKGLSFILKKDSKIPDLVEGDRLRLYQVITNLLDNAIKYTHEGQIILDIQYNQKRANKVNLRFEVNDTGVGIADENSTIIFESFSQLNTITNNISSGTGLGLSIVKGLLTLMGTEIKMKSKVGIGSTFYFDLSLKQPIASKSKQIIVKETKKKQPYLKSDKKFKLLLVEDDINIQTVLFKLLLNTNHFFIDIVSDGALVIEQLINDEYDVILMDINLPNVPGDQVARAIREFPFKNIKNIPIIGLTTYAFKEDTLGFKQAGFNTIISKPFEHEILLDAIFKNLKIK